QSGPFQDGELLVRNTVPATQEVVLYRIDPVSGHGEVLIDQIYAGFSGGGWMVYDPHRDGVLAYTARHPQWASPRLWLARGDGTLADLGFQGAELGGLAPVGDGRVYCVKAGVLHLLDAANQLAPVLDAGGQPIATHARHLIYDPAQNALVGAHMGGLAGPCSQFNAITAVRYELAPDGLSILGSTCNATDYGGSAHAIGIDRMPGGSLLVTVADGFLPNDAFLRLDPVSLAITVWASPQYSDVDGGVWCQTLGKAVLLEDGQNSLHAYSQGGDAAGTLIVTDVLAVDPFTGWSDANAMTDVDLFGPGCGGASLAYGAGSAGTGGIAPKLGAGGCPQ
ncbi:MAG TPA: hypothetical protein VJP77_02455, partial [Planctomycetota bacterium]|nr:hypothetical protein [Planctomycetota bacterium]